jgi:hypothetical protein
MTDLTAKSMPGPKSRPDAGGKGGGMKGKTLAGVGFLGVKPFCCRDRGVLMVC